MMGSSGGSPHSLLLSTDSRPVLLVLLLPLLQSSSQRSRASSGYRGINLRHLANASSRAAAHYSASPPNAGAGLQASSPSTASFEACVAPPALGAADWAPPRLQHAAVPGLPAGSAAGLPADSLEAQRQAMALQQAAAHRAAAAAYSRLPYLAVTLQQHRMAAAAAQEVLEAQLEVLARASLHQAPQLPSRPSAPPAAQPALSTPLPAAQPAFLAAPTALSAPQPGAPGLEDLPADLEGMLMLGCAPENG